MSLNKLASCIRHAYTRERAQSLSKTGDTDAPRLDVVGVTSLQYDIDPETGFMPREEPVQRLGGAGELWETCWDRSSGVPLHTAGGKGETWRAEVDAMVTLDDLSFLSSMQLLRRARAVLTFIAHRYAFSMPEGADPSFVPTIPDGIAVPLLEISQQLDMPPVLTYSDDVLYNWRWRDPQAGFSLDNLDITSSFTETPSERHFYLISLCIEHAGAPALKLMSLVLDELEAPSSTTPASVTSQLLSLAQLMDTCTGILARMQDDCIPSTFFYDIRPWFNGGKRMLAGQLVDWGGPSAGQSSLVHAFDCFLGVDHVPELGEDGFEATFMKRMASYMPAPHRAFLQHLAVEAASLRSYASERPEDVGEAYNAAVDALRRLRDTHVRIVYAFIVAFSRPAKGDDKGPVGTGGSDLKSFLALTRKRTIETRLS